MVIIQVVVMKKVFKVIGIVIGVIAGTVIALFCLLLFFALLSPKKQNQENVRIKIESENKGGVPFTSQPELIYADTKAEALTYHVDYHFGDYAYMAKVNNVVKLFENNEYATMFYQSRNENDEQVEGFVISKFQIKLVDGKKQYALLLVSFTEASNGLRQSFEKNVHSMAPLYDFLSNFSIVEGNRFLFGNTSSELVRKLKIEGQSPDEIIEYKRLGKPEYLWYYENLISDKPSAEFQIEIEE